MVFRKLALLLALLVASGCGRKSALHRAADGFVDCYYVEVDQRCAMVLAAGAAKTELENQLAEVSGVRAMESGPRPRTYYSRVSTQQRNEIAIVVYDLETKFEHGSATKRHALISLSHQTGKWLVVRFSELEGSAPKGP